jgi:hypothetical protein
MARCIQCILSFVNDLCQVDGFLQLFQFSPPIKPTSIDITKILLKVVLNTRNTINISFNTRFKHKDRVTFKSGHCENVLENASHLIKEHIKFSYVHLFLDLKSSTKCFCSLSQR